MRGQEMKVRITKLNKPLPSVKVNLNSSFGGGPWVYVSTNPPCGMKKVTLKINSARMQW